MEADATLPTDPPPVPGAGVSVTFVDEPDEVGPALTDLAADVVGIDVERADGDRYFRKAALVQVGVDGRCVLLDAVALHALPALDALLQDRLAVLHALENDLEPLRRKGVLPARIADTAVAAAVLGLPTGLGPLLHSVLGISLDGDKSAYQRADWEQRPLSAGMAAYAAGDVVHLPALWATLVERLDDQGRRGWYDEEVRHVVDHLDVDTRDWSRVKGAGRLSGRQRAVLRALWEERERLARLHDIAPNRLLHEEVLRDVATDPPRTPTQLVRRSNRRRSLVRRHATDLYEALERGLAAAPEDRERSRRWSDEDRAVYDALRQGRSAIAADLGLDPGVLCPSRSLWASVAGDPRDGTHLCELAGMRAWQTALLADPLWTAYVEARATGRD